MYFVPTIDGRKQCMKGRGHSSTTVVSFLRSTRHKGEGRRDVWPTITYKGAMAIRASINFNNVSRNRVSRTRTNAEIDRPPMAATRRAGCPAAAAAAVDTFHVNKTACRTKVFRHTTTITILLRLNEFASAGLMYIYLFFFKSPA